MSEENPTDIVHQLQSIDSIEQDLADTAAAVVDAASQSHPSQHAAQDQKFLSTQLDNAEAIESALESAIPPAPGSSSTAGASDAIGDNSFTTSGPAPFPDTVVAPSAANDEIGDVIVVENETPTTTNVVEAVVNPENDGNIPIESTEQSSEQPEEQPTEQSTEQPTGQLIEQPAVEIPLAPQSTPAAPTTFVVENVSTTLEEDQPEQIVQTPVPIAHTEAPMPVGLTEYSPSVSQNGELIKSWRADPSNPTLLLSLFNWAVQKTEVEDARAWYRVLAVDNPTATQPLLALINLELALSNFAEVEAIFASTLKGSAGITTAADVSIWTAYLHYIRRQNPLTEGSANAADVRSTITEAYEFALRECGFDRESGDIWDEYLKFVATGPATNQWETQAKNDNLRKIYQRAVCIPLNNIEALWKSYDNFESSFNKLTAKKYLAEKSPAYMTARTALRELRALSDPIPKPILPPYPTFTEQDRQIVGAWKAYLRWEEGNPLVIENHTMLQSRIGYALRKCLGEMRHFAELWHYVASYYSKLGKQDQAAEILEAGVNACPKSFLLTFANAELQEERKAFPTCHSLYTTLISKLNPEVDELRQNVAREVEIARGPPIPGSEKAATAAAVGDSIDVDGNDISDIQRLVEEREQRGELVAQRRGKDVEELMIGISVVWIMYMRFARRAEGIKAARGVFGKARKSPHLTWHVFEASALMEYHTNKDAAVAIRIFELGLKQFSEDVDYVIKYLQFLLSINDDNNARALFERSAVRITGDKARPLWDAWARYEYTYGDLSAVHKLEARFSEVFPEDAPLKRFAQRWSYNGIDQIAIRDLGFNRARMGVPVLPASTIAPTLPPPTASITDPVVAPVPVQPPQESYKRPAPEDITPRQPSSTEFSRSPKRHRAQSPPRRYAERDDRPPAGRYRDSLPPVKAPSSIPPAHLGAGSTFATPPSGGYGGDKDRSGLEKPLAWFMAQLPNARSFDGPIFRPDDIMKLFGGLSLPGAGMLPAPPISRGPAQPPMQSRGYYEPERDRRYGGNRSGRY
ncbi:mRNA 3'-end-processing protein RNA14 [Cryptococcus decagattii]|uniref:mRNA 3'-end-processing protein RNA14 n=1 Tax=Cryptococcus decagattii TaxID=1859122 RepID=A0ABZ2AX38_9TREE